MFPDECHTKIDSNHVCFTLSYIKVLYHQSTLKVASVPIAHSVDLKESYSDMKHLLTAINYELHQWKLCGDLKMISIL